MQTMNLDQAKRSNPHLDPTKLGELLEDLRTMPRPPKKGYRLAPVGSNPVKAVDVWNTNGAQRCSRPCCQD